MRNRKSLRTLTFLYVLATVIVGLAPPQAANALTGTHQMVVAYYPIFPRWYTPDNCLFIGDLTRQYPLLGLYNNTTDTNVIRFDFGCIKNMGATVACTHLVGTTLNTSLINRKSSAVCSGSGWQRRELAGGQISF